MKRGIFLLILLFFIIGALDLTYAKESFQVDNVLLKTAIKSNGSFSTSVRVGGTQVSRDFEVKVNNLEGLVSVDSNRFSLSKGDTKSIGIVFSSNGGEKEGIHVGSLDISSGGEIKKIPIVLEIESSDVLFDSNIEVFPSGVVAPGEKVSAQIKIFDLSNIGISSVEISYFIKGFGGETVISETENVVVEDQVLITKSLNLPDNMAYGQYLFGVVLKYKNSVGTSSSFFGVGKSAGTGGFNIVNSYFLIIALGVVFVLLLLLFYMIYSRDRVLSELKCQYKNEIGVQERLLNERERFNERILKTKEEKEANRKIFKDLRESRREKISKIHTERVKKVKELKKQNKKDEIKVQVAKWKKQGYDTSLFEKSIPGAKDIKKQLAKWKKKGYNTDVLERRTNRKV